MYYRIIHTDIHHIRFSASGKWKLLTNIYALQIASHETSASYNSRRIIHWKFENFWVAVNDGGEMLFMCFVTHKWPIFLCSFFLVDFSKIFWRSIGLFDSRYHWWCPSLFFSFFPFLSLSLSLSLFLSFIAQFSKILLGFRLLRSNRFYDFVNFPNVSFVWRRAHSRKISFSHTSNIKLI